MTAVEVREATEPPEARGITRDAVRMMVAHRSNLQIVHTHAHDLPQFLDEGDLIVVNTSGTLAAALDGFGEDGTPLVVHLSQRLPAGLWLIELRRPNGRATEPWFEDPPGTTLSGSGRSEMSSPGNASWCMRVRMSPGSNVYTCTSGSSAPRMLPICSSAAFDEP